MMEAIGAGASIIAVIELSAKVASLCFEYSTAVKNAKSDIERMQGVANSLKTTLEDAQQLLKSPNGARLPTSQKLRDWLAGCSLQLKELETKLHPGKRHQVMRKIGFRALKWPFTREEVDNVVKNLEKYQQTFSLCLIIDQTSLLLEVGQKIDLANLPIAKDATFDSHADEHEPRCHPNTRVDLLRDITKWAEDPHGECIFWLNGMAGTGKSTISRTVAQSFADRQELGASFFFKRGERDRGTAALFFTTIAAQLISKESALAPYVRNAVDSDPAISGKAMKEQFEKLILLPLGHVYRDPDNPVRIAIVVDALDECDRDGDVKGIIYQLSQAKTLSSVRLRIFVTSRPELPIRLGFTSIKGKYQDLVLHEIPEPIIEHDISTFFEYKLARIRNEYNSLALDGMQLPSDWPSQKNIQILVRIAVPLFIFAATVCRFIADPAWADPAGQLTKVLEYQTMAQDADLNKLDATYLPILNQLVIGRTSSEKDRLVDEFRDVVGSIVLLAEPLSISSLARLLSISKAAIDGRLRSLHSVLRVPSNADSPVRLFHLSFRDFLVDPAKRATNPFYVDEKKTHKRIASSCLRFMNFGGYLKENICNLKMPGALRMDVNAKTIDACLPADIRYACLYWVYHLKQSNTCITDGDQVHLFLKHHFLHWLEGLSFMGKISESISMINTLQELLEPIKSAEVLAFLHDGIRFILNCRSTVDLSPLQIYSSAIVFAPTTSIIRNLFKDNIPQWIPLLPKVDLEWNTCLQTLEGHSNSVSSVAFSGDSKHLVSGSVDKTVKIWDVTTGACLQTLEGHGDWVYSVAFLGDSKHLASGSADETIKIWDATTGACLQTLEGHGNWVFSIAFLGDGKHLASGSADETIKIWDATTGACLQTLKGHSDSVYSVAFLGDGKHLVSGSADKTVKIWDATTGACLQTLEGHGHPIHSVAFSGNDKHLASGSADKTVKIWDATTGACLQTLEGHGDWVYSVAFLGDGKHLASGSADKTVKIWDATTGACLQTLEGHSHSVHSVAFSGDGKHLTSGSVDETVKIWDATTSACLQTLEGHSNLVHSVAFSGDGKHLASGSVDKTVKIWDATTGACLQTLEGHSHSVHSVAFSGDSEHLVSGSDDKTVKIWDAITGACLQTLEGHSFSVHSVAFSGNGKHLASGSADETVRIWDANTGACLQTLEGHSNWVYSVAFSGDGKHLVSGSADKTVKIWDAITGACLQTLEGHGHPVHSVAFSGNGKHLASGSADKTVKIWDATTATCLQTLNVGSTLCNISFDITGAYLYTEIGSIDLNMSSALNFTLAAHPGPYHQGYGFSNNNWITWNSQNLLWLPSTYRPSYLGVVKSTIAIGSRSGRIIIIQFSFDNTLVT